MLILSILKLLADLLLFWLVGGLFFAKAMTFKGIILSLIGSSIAMAVFKGGEYADSNSYIGKILHGIRYAGFIVCLLPYVLTEVWSGSGWVKIILFIPLVYTVYLCKKAGLEDMMADYSINFIRFTIIAVAATLIGQLNGNPVFCFILLFIFMLVSILNLQLQRLYISGSLSPKNAGICLGLMGLVTGGVLVASSPLIWTALSKIAGWCYRHIFVKILTVIINIIVFIIGLIYKLLAFLASVFHFEFNPLIQEAQIEAGGSEMEAMLMQKIGLDTELLSNILFLLVLLAAAVVFFKMLNRRKSKLVQADVKTVEEYIQPVKKKKLPHGNSGAVRKNYRKLLVWLMDRGEIINSASTSEDISRIVRTFTDEKQNEELRDIYRRVRYSDEDTSSEDVKRTREITHRIMGR